LAEFLAERRAARLAREDEWDRCAGEIVVQEPDLRRFAGSLDAFERDEQAGRYCAASL
jgi:hypothetical protein